MSGGEWRTAARRTRVGERIELTSLPGYWIKPQKYSVEAANKIRALEQQLQDNVTVEGRDFIVRKAKAARQAADELDIASVLAACDETELVWFLAQIKTADPAVATMHQRLVLLHGIGEHNFTDENGVLCKVEESFVDQIMDYAEPALEMYTIVQEWNRPFGRERSKNFRGQSSPSTTEKSSPKTSPSMGSTESTPETQ